jgi:hypothetical protein
MKKTSIPHIYLNDRGTAIDLYFEFLDINNRKKIVNDIKEHKTINLPNFGNIEGILIDNTIKHFNENDIQKNDENFIMSFLQERNAPKRPILEYDEKKHEYKLKSKFDIEKILQNFYKDKHI